jgi:hypothetical protein
MTESPQRSASGGGQRSASTPTRCHVIRRERPTRSRPSPDPCPAAGGAPRPRHGRLPTHAAARLPDGSTVWGARCVRTGATATTTTQPMTARPRR